MKHRKLNQLRAWLGGYAWKPCPLCGQCFGGHEWADADGMPSMIPDPQGRPGISKAICPDCTAIGLGVLLEPKPSEWEIFGRLALPEFSIIDETRAVPRTRNWCQARTAVRDGLSDPEPIVDGVTPVTLPDDYVGPFKVFLIADDGAVMTAAEGRRIHRLTYEPLAVPLPSNWCARWSPSGAPADPGKDYRGGLATWALGDDEEEESP